MTISEMIEVMEHYRDGGEVEGKARNGLYAWNTVKEPLWNFANSDYRVKKKPKNKTVHEWMFKDSLNQWFLSANLFTEDEAQKHLGTYAIMLKTGRQWEVPND